MLGGAGPPRLRSYLGSLLYTFMISSSGITGRPARSKAAFSSSTSALRAGIIGARRKGVGVQAGQPRRNLKGGMQAAVALPTALCSWNKPSST